MRYRLVGNANPHLAEIVGKLVGAKCMKIKDAMIKEQRKLKSSAEIFLSIGFPFPFKGNRNQFLPFRFRSSRNRKPFTNLGCQPKCWLKFSFF